nr:serine-rich adhesin for platelets-like isoform X2 [Crassostrea gigas]
MLLRKIIVLSIEVIISEFIKGQISSFISIFFFIIEPKAMGTALTGASNTDTSEPKAMGTALTGASNTDTSEPKAKGTALTGASNTDTSEPKAMGTALTDASNTDTSEPKAMGTALTDASNTDTSAPKAMGTALTGASNTDTSEPKAMGTALTGASNTDTSEPKAMGTALTGASNTDTSEPKAMGTALPVASNTDTSEPKAMGTALPVASNTDTSEPKAMGTALTGASNTDTSEPKAMGTALPVASNTDTSGQNAMDTSVTSASNTDTRARRWTGYLNYFIEVIRRKRRRKTKDVETYVEPSMLDGSIFYCQKDDDDKHFKKFCKKFLQNVSIKQLRNEEDAPVQVFLVLDLPIDNRQDITGVLSKLIMQTMTKHQFNGNTKVHLVHISFDGNCSRFPPNLMNDSLFEELKNTVNWNFESYIDIIYTDDYLFTDCDINIKAAKKLRLCSWN